MYYQHIRHILPYSFNSMGKNWGGTWWHTTGGTSTPWRNLERRVSGLRSGFPSGSLAMVQPGQPGSHLKPNLSVKRKLRWHLELIGGLEHVYFSDILGMSSSQLTFTPWFFVENLGDLSDFSTQTGGALCWPPAQGRKPHLRSQRRKWMPCCRRRRRRRLSRLIRRPRQKPRRLLADVIPWWLDVRRILHTYWSDHEDLWGFLYGLLYLDYDWISFAMKIHEGSTFWVFWSSFSKEKAS